MQNTRKINLITTLKNNSVEKRHGITRLRFEQHVGNKHAMKNRPEGLNLTNTLFPVAFYIQAYLFYCPHNDLTLITATFEPIKC